jgi:hypothetical protein
MTFSFYDADTLPSRFDIIYCRFPYEEAPGLPGPKPRPGLVYDGLINPADGLPYVFVHYGTSQNFDRLNPFQFVIGNSADIVRSGLTFMTRFDLRKPEPIPWAEEFVCMREGASSLILGRLPPRQIDALRRHGDALKRHFKAIQVITQMQDVEIDSKKKPGQIAKQNRRPRPKK